ncbi:MAG: sigma-70 family RNA polymerase sigma factor [Deltaproteobacteria bacterium]|nr:sigma-70 family RNA polymerase sigma factor [Deltaproteobacteria bacterium]
MRTEGNILAPRRRAAFSVMEQAGDAEDFSAVIAQWTSPPAGTSAPLLGQADRAELLALAGERDSQLFWEGLSSFAVRQELAGRTELAAQMDAEISAAAGGEAAARAQLRLDAIRGRGAVGGRVEFLLRRFAAEASDPSMLLAMSAAGLVFRATRLATLSRLAATPGGSFLTRGLGARAVSSFAGFALEAPAFTLSARLTNEALGRSQDWSGTALRRDIASSYLVLGGMKLAGVASSALHRRIVGSESSSWVTSLSAGLFHQAGTLSGIFLGHTLEQGLGLRPQMDGATTLTDSLALLLQFHVAGRISGASFGDSVGRWERALDLQNESLASVREPLRHSWEGAALGPRPAYVSMMSAHSAAEVLPGAEPLASPPTESFPRPTSLEAERPVSQLVPAGPKTRPENVPPSAYKSFRELIARSRILPESEKREVIARIQSGDESAKEELILSDIKSVVRIARSYGRKFQLPASDVQDLMQEGAMGLLKGAERFDFRNVNFLTYATWWVRQNITRYIIDHLQDIRIPAHRLTILRQLNREIRELEQQGKENGTLELAPRLEMSPDQVEELQSQAQNSRTLRLDTPIGEEGGGLLLDLVASDEPAPDRQLVGSGLRNLLANFIASRKSPEDRRILEARFFDADEPGLKEIADELGITKAEAMSRERRLLQLARHFVEHAGVRSDGGGQAMSDSARLAPVSAPLTPDGGPESSPISGGVPEVGPVFRPRIAVIGFGMAGIGATNALRNSRLFSDDPRAFRPEITVFEGMNRVGGKVAPNNLGAQFVDAEDFYPIDRLIQNLGLKTSALRGDYDSAPYITRSGEMISGAVFSRSLRLVRQAAREALRTKSWEELDRESAVDFIRGLGGNNKPLDAHEVEAMISRLGFEEGTLNVSTLSFAINLAKSETPMDRFEVVGGLHRLAEAEREAVEAGGGRVLLGHPVRGLELMQDGMKVLFQRDGNPAEEVFDYAVLALAPEHLKGLEVQGTQMPIQAVGALTPAHIRKTNLRSNLALPHSERATPRFAMWFSPDPGRDDGRQMVTFFHGWNGEKPLHPGEMIREAYGSADPDAVVGFDSQIWDGHPQDGIPHFYTTMPEPGKGYDMVRFAMDQYFEGRYDGERLKVANHVLGLGCYIRDAALSGEWAAISLMRGMGMDVRRAYVRNPRPEREFIGADRIK